TYFVEKIWRDYLDKSSPMFPYWMSRHEKMLGISIRNCYDFKPKLHTVRKGKRWKAGDFFSPRVWSDRPYASKQVVIAPDIKLERVADIEISATGLIVI